MRDFNLRFFLITVFLCQLTFGQKINKSDIIGTWQLFENKKPDTKKIDVGELVRFDDKGDTLSIEENKAPEINDKRFGNIYLKIEKKYLILYFGVLGEKLKYKLNGNILEIEDKRQFKIIELSKNTMLISDPRTLIYNKVEVDLSDYQLIKS